MMEVNMQVFAWRDSLGYYYQTSTEGPIYGPYLYSTRYEFELLVTGLLEDNSINFIWED